MNDDAFDTDDTMTPAEEAAEFAFWAGNQSAAPALSEEELNHQVMVAEGRMEG